MPQNMNCHAPVPINMGEEGMSFNLFGTVRTHPLRGISLEKAGYESHRVMRHVLREE